ncbi:CLUMA_CG008576, isoform A [Clunio marinus]|uniref:CLUMA_CG008576, isoform A n=1 Tax=Clunio marinus TaxID=568069 RepID=A0A1J1I5T1_9DIPT|nr:CLUMA_CG008576, isoform A [Clunio marinus]
MFPPLTSSRALKKSFILAIFPHFYDLDGSYLLFHALVSVEQRMTFMVSFKAYTSELSVWINKGVK